MKVSSKKYAVLNSGYKKLAVPVDFLPKLLEVAFIVDTTYTDGKEQISQVQEIDRVDIYNAIDLEMAIAEEKLKS